MGIFSFLFGDSNTAVDHDDTVINPANGNPMVGGVGGVDIEGNPYGTDNDDDFLKDSFTESDDSWMSDDSWGSDDSTFG